jgi:hypothetical protein
MHRTATAQTILGAGFDTNRYVGFLQALSAARQGPTATRRQHLAQHLTDAGQLVAAHYLRNRARAAYFVSDCCRTPRQLVLLRPSG